MVKSHRKKTHGHSHSTKSHSKKPNTTVWVGTVIILAILLVLSIFTQGFSTITFEANNKETTTTNYVDQVDNPLDVEIYVMSQCPYGVQAENTMFEAIQDIGEEHFNLDVEYIVTDLEDGTFQSLHGEPETQGNIVQLCAKEVDETKYLDFVLCMNKQPQLIPDNWNDCATELDYDVEAIKTCYEGEEGKTLLSASAQKAMQAGATGSPTIIVDGEMYAGGRSTNDFKRNFCYAFDDEQPQACADVPEPVAVELVVVNDKTCTTCQPDQIVQVSESLFPGLEVRTVDITSKEGEKLVEENEIEFVPAFIFDKQVVQTQAWSQEGFPNNFVELNSGSYMLRNEAVGSTHYVDEEKKQEALDAMGIVTGDNKPQVDFFVMSFCPYGNIADELMGEVYATIGDDVEFNPHYIYYENYQGGGSTYCMDEESKYCSMHGVVEANQNVREQCVLDKYGLQAWFDFTKAINADCSSQNADSCYVDVATDLGYDVDYIEQCFEEEKFNYAAEDARLMSLFGAQGSPAIYIDGVSYSGARDANSILGAICAEFDEAPQACNSVIESEIQNAPAGQC